MGKLDLLLYTHVYSYSHAVQSVSLLGFWSFSTGNSPGGPPDASKRGSNVFPSRKACCLIGATDGVGDGAAGSSAGASVVSMIASSVVMVVDSFLSSWAIVVAKTAAKKNSRTSVVCNWEINQKHFSDQARKIWEIYITRDWHDTTLTTLVSSGQPNLDRYRFHTFADKKRLILPMPTRDNIRRSNYFPRRLSLKQTFRIIV